MNAVKLARVAFHGARMGRDLGGVLVDDDAQFRGVPCADASGVGGDGGGVTHRHTPGVCIHLLAMLGVE